MDVVDRQQQTLRGRRQSYELCRGHEEPLVRALAGPLDLGSGESPVDLLAVMIGQAVEQGRMAPADVGERLDDRRIRPGALDRRRRAVTDSEVELLRPCADRLQQRRLAHAGGTAEDQGSASAGSRVDQCLLGDRQLEIATDQRVVTARCHVVLGQQPIAQRQRLTSGRHTELAPQGAVQSFELAKSSVTIAVGRMATHECEVGQLIAGVELDDSVPPAVEAQEVEMPEPELLATLFDPELVPIFG